MDTATPPEWALYIDIEGFATNFERGAKRAFVGLTNSLFTLAQNLFEHKSIIQYGGDGFLIKELGLYQNDIKVPIEIAATLLKSILVHGAVGRGQLAYGYTSDISGLYSEKIQERVRVNGVNSLLEGRNSAMFINPLIGTSIINSYKLKGPAGPLLLVDSFYETQLTMRGVPFIKYEAIEQPVLLVNWLAFQSEPINDMLSHLNINPTLDFSQMLSRYITRNAGLRPDWIAKANELISDKTDGST